MFTSTAATASAAPVTATAYERSWDVHDTEETSPWLLDPEARPVRVPASCPGFRVRRWRIELI